MMFVCSSETLCPFYHFFFLLGEMTLRSTSLCSYIFSSGIIECMLFTFESKVSLMCQWCGIFHCLWWTASINPRLYFHMQALLPWVFPFCQLNLYLYWNDVSSSLCHWWTALIKQRLLVYTCRLCFLKTFPFYQTGYWWWWYYYYFSIAFLII